MVKWFFVDQRPRPPGRRIDGRVAPLSQAEIDEDPAKAVSILTRFWYDAHHDHGSSRFEIVLPGNGATVRILNDSVVRFAGCEFVRAVAVEDLRCAVPELSPVLDAAMRHPDAREHVRDVVIDFKGHPCHVRVLSIVWLSRSCAGEPEDVAVRFGSGCTAQGHHLFRWWLAMEFEEGKFHADPYRFQFDENCDASLGPEADSMFNMLPRWPMRHELRDKASSSLTFDQESLDRVEQFVSGRVLSIGLSAGRQAANGVVPLIADPGHRVFDFNGAKVRGFSSNKRLWLWAPDLFAWLGVTPDVPSLLAFLKDRPAFRSEEIVSMWTRKSFTGRGKGRPPAIDLWIDAIALRDVVAFCGCSERSEESLEEVFSYVERTLVPVAWVDFMKDALGAPPGIDMTTFSVTKDDFRGGIVMDYGARRSFVSVRTIAALGGFTLRHARRLCKETMSLFPASFDDDFRQLPVILDDGRRFMTDHYSSRLVFMALARTTSPHLADAFMAMVRQAEALALSRSEGALLIENVRLLA